MVEVFSTNVYDNDQSDTLIQKLLAYFPSSKINFDLEDCDKVLRVEGKDIATHKIIEMLSLDGYQCHILE